MSDEATGYESGWRRDWLNISVFAHACIAGVLDGSLEWQVAAPDGIAVHRDDEGDGLHVTLLLRERLPPA